MPDLFQTRIANWSDWGRIFQDRELFRPLAEAIMLREKLPVCPLLPLTPGTHAVFAAGDYVLKIYAPAVSGLDFSDEFENEVYLTRKLAAAGLPSADFIAAGCISDRYDFFYLILSRVEGQLAADCWADLDSAQKDLLCEKMNQYIDLIKEQEPYLPKPSDIRNMPERQSRWQKFSPGMQAMADRRARQILADCRLEEVLVHGDLTAENVLVTAGPDWILLDFADCKLAPAWYEWPALVFDLYQAQPLCVRTLAGGQDDAAFIDTLIDALAIHDFGGLILEQFLLRQQIQPGSLTGLCQLKTLLSRLLLPGSDSFEETKRHG